jgi:hypothetical protein
MNRFQILLGIMLIGAAATVVGLAVFRDAKSPAVTASAPPQVAGKENRKTNNLAAAGKRDSRTKATSSLQAFRDRITKARGEKDRAKRMDLLAEAVQTLDPSQIRQTLAEVEAMKDCQFRPQLRGMLLSRWGESDPKAALAWIAIISLGLKDGAPLWVSAAIVLGTFLLSVIIHTLYAIAFSTPVMVRLYGRARRAIQGVLGVFFAFAGLRMLMHRS